MKQWILLAAIGFGAIGMTARSNAAVIVTFEQVGTDVLATWRGFLDLGTYDGVKGLGDLYLLANSFNSSQSIFNGHPNASAEYFVGGTASATSLTERPMSGTNLTGGTGAPFPGGFGFVGGTFVIPDFVTGSAPASSVFDFGTGSTYTMTWQGRTLSGIGAASFNNTLAWTSSAGGTNTVSFTTVPEASTSLLGLVGALALLRRRRC